ncbi:MAG: M16 family metallopeptidase [Terriglobia bacterium]
MTRSKDFLRNLLKRLRWAFLLVSLCLPGLCRAGNAQVQLPQAPIHTYLLANGLEVVMAEDHEAPVVAVQVWYHVGSKDERPGMSGFAHLFEHLMFDGTTNILPGAFSNYIVRAGGIDNAYTTGDVTVFWETVPANDLPVALWLEADRMRNLRITESTFNNERAVVEEEMRQRFTNQPYGGVIESLYAHAFTVSPYRHRPIGSVQDLNNARLSEVQSFYDAYYVPNNATLVLAGDFDEKQAEGWVQHYFGPVKGSGVAIPRNYPQEPPQTAERMVALRKDVALPAFVEGYHIPADGTPDSYPLRLAAKLLAGGDSSWIYRKLVYSKQMAMQVDCEGDFTEEPNLFFIMAVMNPGNTPHQGEAEIESILGRLKRGAISKAELERAKNQILRDLILERESARSRADAIGYDTVVLKNPDLYNTEISRFMQVTAADIQRAAQKYFVPQNLTLVEVYPRNGGVRSFKPTVERGK